MNAKAKGTGTARSPVWLGILLTLGVPVYIIGSAMLLLGLFV
jgi:hypothetical protein